MIRSRDLSIRKKLIAAFVTITVVALILSGTSLVIASWFNEREAAMSELETLAELIGANSRAALIFEDAAAAEETLDTLRIWPDIVYGSLHDTEGTQLARFVRDGDGEAWSGPPALGEKSAVYADGIITVASPVIFDNQEIGGVVIRSSMQSRLDRLARNIAISFIVLLVSFLIAMLIAVRLSRSFTDPLRKLSSMMQRVTEHHDYSQRADLDQKDEVGTLANGIDRMLTVIEEREESLEKSHKELEETVSQRTAELLEANTRLKEELREREKTETELQQAHQALEQHYRKFSLLSQMNDRLQICHSIEETRPVISHYIQKLFADGIGGALYTFNDSHSLVEALVSWGEQEPAEETFEQNDCWALRQGRAHIVLDPAGELICDHCKDDISGPYMCIPLIGYGDVIGLLHLRVNPEWKDYESYHATEELSQLGVSASEHLALALANLRLREELQEQSVRDPLTGLFNRRYMQETLEREMARSQRAGDSLAVIMLDIDYFKKFNDTYGHDAGDTVLRELGELLANIIRDDDVACRFGGEEFLVIMPGISRSVAEQRAEEIRQAVKLIKIQHKGKRLEGLSVSLGIGLYPEHGDSVEAITNAADAALYKAKELGRDRYVVAKAKKPGEKAASQTS
ncbi:MAG: diguanylate cyclase [Gammaproteobacteria bacterium]